MSKTIYRKCECGETAHDAKATRGQDFWSYSWNCRNCGKAAKNRLGTEKLKIVFDDGRIFTK